MTILGILAIVLVTFFVTNIRMNIARLKIAKNLVITIKMAGIGNFW